MADAAPQETAESEVPGFSAGLRHGWRTLGVIWTHSRGLCLLIGAIILVIAFLPPAALLVARQIVDGVLLAIETGSVADRDAALGWVAVEAAILASLLALRRLLQFYKSRLHAELGFVVGEMILARAQALSLPQVENPAIQQQLVMARQFATVRPYNLVNRFFDIAQHGLTLVIMGGLLAAFSPALLLLVIAGGLPLFIGNLKFSGAAYRFYTRRTPQTRERSYLESLITVEGAARERLHYRFGEAIMQRYRKLFHDLYDEDRGLQLRRAWIGAALGIVSSAVFLGGKLWIVWVTIAGAITLGQMTMYVGLLKQGQGSLTNLLAAFNGIVEDVLYVSNLYALIDLPRETRPAGKTAGPDGGDGLRFEGVSFTYPGRDAPALNDVSFHLPGGANLGIVGANGSGKTTLVKLAVGLYAPDRGRILLDGLDLREWDQDALSDRMGVMFQPNTNYKLTARDNIAAGLGFADMPDTELDRAAEEGLASELIASLPHGYDTRLSKRFLDGTELSGGQWQRLAMARAYLNRKADMIILDEPTAAMDPAAEAAFMKRSHEGRTVILISHRLANIRRADKIILLDKGRLLENGSHDELMAQRGVYAGLFEAQADPYRAG